jgi:hypothetical protein
VPILCGVGVVIAGSAILALFLSGESAQRAKLEAAKGIGPGFTLRVTSLMINQSGRHKSVSAVVTAWNDREIREIPVHWDEVRN